MPAVKVKDAVARNDLADAILALEERVAKLEKAARAEPARDEGGKFAGKTDHHEHEHKHW